MRTGLDDEIKRLTALPSQAGETQERMRQDYAELVAVKDQDLRQAEERHAGQEKRILAEVDRARQTAKALEAELAREQQRRAKARKRPRNGWRESWRSFTRFGKRRGKPRPGCASNWPPKASTWRRPAPRQKHRGERRSARGLGRR